MSSVRSPMQAGKSPIVRLFEQSRPAISSLPGVQALIGNFVDSCSGLLRESYALPATVKLTQVSQGTINSLLEERAAAISVAGFIPEWNDNALLSLDSLLFFRMLDAIYGGEPASRTSCPSRPLTLFERSLAVKLATALIGLAQSAFGEINSFSLQAVRHLEEGAPELLARSKEKYLVVQLRLVEFNDGFTLSLPLVGLELSRDKLSVGQKDEENIIDPSWTKKFKANVSLSKVRLLASADGPPMVLSDVALLKPGTRIEFDGEVLRNVRIESEGQSIFVGRLGQTKGQMTVLVEAPAKSNRSEDADA